MTTNKPEVVVYRYTASRSVGKRNRKWHYQESFPHAANREVAEIGQIEELIRLSNYEALQAELETVKKVAYGNIELLWRNEALQAECEKLRKDAERYRWLCEFREWPDEVDAAIDCANKVLIDAAIDAAMRGDQP